MGGGNFDYKSTAAIIIYVCTFLAAILINIILARLMCKIAQKKGYNPKEEHIFAICFFLGIFGWFYTVGLPDLVLREMLGGKNNNKTL